MPKRVQMSRQHPWRADNPDAVIVDRRTKYGNPFAIEDDKHGGFVVRGLLGEALHKCDTIGEARQVAVELFRDEFADKIADMARAELAGKDVACWCALTDFCHGDTWLELANP